MPTGLFTPVLNDRTRAPYFFNGRLLTGEAMTDEQRAQHVAHELLAQGLGDGVAYGLQVEQSKDFNTIDRPVVTVKAGAAVSRRGDLMLLTADAEVELVRPATASVAPQRIFEACNPPQQGAYVADAGVYLLTIAPVTVGNGLAPVSGLGGGNGCNVKYRVDAVQFRLVQLPVAPAVLSDSARLRNLVAYQCFGVADLLDFASDPFAAPPGTEPRTLLDHLRDQQLGDCEVPLAVLHWTATGGLQFVDLWSVRRRLTRTRNAAPLFLSISDVRLAAAEAMVLQFERHVLDLIAASVSPTLLRASHSFRYLPPIGTVPLPAPGRKGIAYDQFFLGRTYNPPRFVNGAKLAPILRTFLTTAPIDFGNNEMVWLYTIVQNIREANAGGLNAPQTYLIFATGQVPYQAEAQFDVSYWNYSNYV